MAIINGTAFVNCTALASRSSFPAYIQTLRDETSDNFDLLGVCKLEVCSALWGTGNTDISGIGMIIGYLFESFLGFSFALGVEISRNNSAILGKRFKTAVHRGLGVFFDCAIYFAASVQIACVVVLVRKDFGISANGLGGFTVQITWAVALICLLPLLYPLVVMGIFAMEGSEKELEEAESPKSRHEFRFYLFAACWVMFLYTFISRMIGDYAPSQIGQGAGDGGTTIVTIDEWNTINTLCFTGVQQLTDSETKAVEAFGTAGSIIVSLFVVCQLLWFITENIEPSIIKWIEEKTLSWREKSQIKVLLPIMLLVLVPTLTIPEIWGIFRLRSVQESLSDASGNQYTDNQWTFGQVVAVVIFAPVIVEVVYVWVRHRERGSN